MIHFTLDAGVLQHWSSSCSLLTWCCTGTIMHNAKKADILTVIS